MLLLLLARVTQRHFRQPSDRLSEVSIALCEAKRLTKQPKNVDTVIQITYYINSKNAVSKTARSERRLFLNTKSFEEMIYLFSVSRIQLSRFYAPLLIKEPGRGIFVAQCFHKFL